MTIKIFNGSTWNAQKSLRFYNGSVWSNAKKGWIYNGSLWSQFYPDYPLNTASPTVSGSTTQGQTLSCTTGTWNANDAYIGTYTYQWTRAGSNISGATSSTYATVVADVGNAIACKVTSTNDRGATTVTSSNSITVVSAIPGAPSGLSLSDTTDTPPTPGSMSVSSVTQTSLNFSFGAATGTFTAYEVLTSNSNHVVSSLNQTTRTGSITGGSAGESYFVSAFTTNTNCKLTASWSAGTNATSYDVYVGGSYVGNTTSTSYTHTAGSIGSKSVNIRSRNASGAETTGVSGSITLSKKYSSGGTAASGNFLSNYTVSWNANGGTVSPTSSTVSPGSSVTAPTPTRSGYSFSGWYNASSGGSLIVNAGNSYTPSSSITLFAQWTLTPITPSIGSLSITTSDTAQTLITVNWSSTNQNTWSLTVSPSTGGSSGGSSFSGTSQTSKYIGVGTAGTTYTIQLTVTSTTGHTASSSVNHTPPSAGTAPSTPTSLSNTYSSGPTWSGSWAASTGTAPITYYWTLYQSATSGGSINATASGNTTGTSFSQSMNSANGFWAYFTVYASNSVGNSTTATSGWA
jgi:uncharacterized repeat protein (TIGR02543 family)